MASSVESNAAAAGSEDLNASQRRKLILAGQFAFLPTGILTTLLGPMLPILSVRWGLDDSQAGNLFLVQFLSQLAGVQLSGVMLAKIGFRPAFLAGLLLMAIGVSTLLLGSPMLGLVSVAVYGLGIGTIIPTDNLMVAEVSTGSRSAAVSLLNCFWGVGAVLCALLVAWFHAHHFLIAFLLGVGLFLVVFGLAVRRLPFPGVPKTARTAVPWREIVRSPITWLFCVVFFLYPGAETCVGGWIGSFVARMSPREASLAPLMPAFFWAALTVGRGVGGFVLSHVSERRVLQAGYGLASISIGLLLISSTLTGVIISVAITGLSFATLYPVAIARLTHHFGPAARSVGAVLFSLASFGPAVMPWLVGAISQQAGSLRAGLAVPFVASVVLFAIHLKEW